MEGSGDTIHSKPLYLVVKYNVTANLKRGGKISTMVDLKKIGNSS